MPKGKLIIIGGAVDKGSFTEKQFGQPNNMNFFEHGILSRVIRESGKADPNIEILPTASQMPHEVGNEYIKAFKTFGVTNVHVMHLDKREEANSDVFCERLKKADILWVTGGDQLRITSILGGTEFLKVLKEKYQHQENFVIAGTSAGAAAASDNMIYQGSSKEALLKGEIKITKGLGLINDVIIDTHFVQRGRIGRLFQAVVSNPSILGIGLGEDTGLLIQKGKYMEAIGSGLVILVDGRKIVDTNITEVSLGAPISIENLTVHVMSYCDKFDFNKHKLTISKTKKNENEEEQTLKY